MARTVPTALRRLLTQLGITEVGLCLYPLDATTGLEDRPLFFYHLEKAGGLAVTAALQVAVTVSRQLGRGHMDNLRFHADDAIVPQALTAMRTAPCPFTTYVGKPGVGTFGVHREAARDWVLMTLLREPVGRLISNYYYLLRRGLRPGPASEADFRAYIRAPENVNYQCQMLTPVPAPEDPETLLARARDSLATFHVVGTTETLEETLLGVWSAYGFPAFLSPVIHAGGTRPVDLAPLRDEVEALNQADMALYQTAQATTRTLGRATPENEATGARVRLPDRIMVAHDGEAEGKANLHCKVLGTQAFVDRATRQPGSLRTLLASLT